MTTVGSFGIELGLNTARFESGLKQAGNSTQRFKAGFASAMSGIATASTLAVGGLLAVGAATKKAVDFASEIKDASTAAGIGAESYQAWGYQAGLAGVKQEEFASAVSKANVVIGKAAEGNKAAAEVFARLGVSIRDQSGALRSTESIVLDYADGIAGLKSTSEQAAAAQALFGRAAGPQLVPFLAQGSRGIRDASEAAKEFGAVISQDLIDKADDAGDKLGTLGTVVTAQLTSALITLTPVITTVAQAFADAAPHIAAFFNLFREGTAEALTGKMGSLEKGIKSAADEAKRLGEAGDFEGRNRAIAAQVTLMEALVNVRAKYNALQHPNKPAAAVGTPDSRGAVDDPAGAAEAAREAARAARAAERDQAKADVTDYTNFAGSEAIRLELEREESNQRMIEDSRSAFDQLRRENEQYAEDVNNQLLNDQKASLDATLAEWEDTNAQIADMAAANAERVADGFERVVFAGFKDGAKGMKQAFKQVLSEMVIDLGRSALREALTNLFNQQGGGGGGASGGSSIFSTIASAVGSFFGGSSAGGSVAAGANGLSFTVPGPTSGDHVVPIFRANGGEQVTVTPRGQGQGGGGEGVSVTYNIDARGADPASEARMRNAIRESEQRTIAVITDKVRRRRL